MEVALPKRPAIRVLRISQIAGRLALCAVLSVPASNAHALFIVNQPWVKPGTRASEAYMVLTSTEGAKLVGVRSPIAANASLRAPATRGERHLAAIPLPAGKAIVLSPSADHIALSGLSRPFKLGERVLLTLTIETTNGTREEIGVDAEVRNESPVDAERRAHRH